MAGNDFTLAPGDELEVREEVAKAWSESGTAEIIEEEKPKKAALKKGDK